MIRVWAGQFCSHMRSLQYMEWSLDEIMKTLGNVNAPLLEEHKNYYYPQLNTLHEIIKGINLIATQRLIERIIIHLPNTTYIRLHELVSTIPNILEKELDEHCFMYVPKDQAFWLNNEEGFGQEVNDNFPSAKQDIYDACNCFAVGQYTACVFHLMRVAEIGLRVLAWDRRIKFKKQSPLELKDWDEILKGLEGYERNIQNLPKTSAREAQFEFYHGAMVQLRAFKNLYRHRTMHAREHYDLYQAQGALMHVSEFMQILSRKISETKRTPLIWKKS